MNQTELNKANLTEDQTTLFKIDSEVMTNKALVYTSRAMIEENRLMILSNYAASFMGNRQLANQNTDDIFKNRELILNRYDCQSDVEENFIQAQKNRARLDYLAHRSKLNTLVLDVSEKMAAINTQLIEINKQIMAANENIVEFNSEHITTNLDLIEGDNSPEKATTKTNAVLIAQNKKAMHDVMASAQSNRARMNSVISSSLDNSDALIENKSEIAERRESIMNNRGALLANKNRILR
ncbi:MAG: hypothetical protein CMK36_01270 [Porticoccaceae bacterium]|nr:hypothetical protein [Porticoccaceae bacterium]